jgi:hypothetical protein
MQASTHYIRVEEANLSCIVGAGQAPPSHFRVEYGRTLAVALGEGQWLLIEDNPVFPLRSLPVRVAR